MPRQFTAGFFFTFIGLAVAYVLATAYVDFRLPGDYGYDFLITRGLDLRIIDEDLFTHVWALFLILAIGGFALGAQSATEKLTRQGTSSWQSLLDLRRNALVGKPGRGFILAKTTSPKRHGSYITSEKHPNCLIVAPTGAGKGVGFVYPNLFSFQGSTVTLDIKGENFDVTARWRASQGDKVFKFAPAQFGELSHRYNPLERIGKIKDYSQRSFELRKIATLFLQADNAGEWINGAIQMFTVCGGIAYQRGDFTLGGIYKVVSGGASDLKKHMTALAKEAREPALQNELSGLAKLENKTLGSYQSVMNNAGFDLWSNPHIADMTSESDFSFDNLRRERTSIYFIIADADIEPLSGLVRLFFNELVATIQQRKPGTDEPHHAMLILDEFHRLGKMSKVADAMTTIRGFNGRIAIITQTIPKLDAIYSYEERLSIQGGAGLKLYMTPSEEMTIEDLSKACGMTTKRVMSRSQKAGLGERATFSERTEERPLLTEDEARRLDEDVSIIIVNGRQPIKAKRIVHYEDRNFAPILKASQTLPWEPITNKLVEGSVRRNEQRSIAAAAGGGTSQAVAATSVSNPARTDDAVREAQPSVPTTDDLKRIEDLMDRFFSLFEKAKDDLPPSEDPSTQTSAGAEVEQPETPAQKPSKQRQKAKLQNVPQIDPAIMAAQTGA